jgi:hypothetical protein
MLINSQLKSIIKIEESKIEDYEPDIERRQVLYPNVHKIEIVKQIYDENIITIERQYRNLKVRQQVKNLIEKSIKKDLNESERIIYMEEPRKYDMETGGYQPIYIPSFEKYDSIINKKEEKIEMYQIDKSKIEEVKEVKEPEGYLPPDVKQNENVSVVVKEIPNYLTVFEVKKTLREMFEPFGMITNINVLTRFNEGLKSNMPIGIAFIDFCNKEDVEKLLNSSQRFRISNSILKLELSNGKR